MAVSEPVFVTRKPTRKSWGPEVTLLLSKPTTFQEVASMLKVVAAVATLENKQVRAMARKNKMRPEPTYADWRTFDNAATGRLPPETEETPNLKVFNLIPPATYRQLLPSDFAADPTESRSSIATNRRNKSEAKIAPLGRLYRS